MATLTKLALTQINARLAAENESLRKQVVDLTLEVSMHTTPTRRVQHAMPAWQAERAAAMAAAREMAMRTRMHVKV